MYFNIHHFSATIVFIFLSGFQPTGSLIIFQLVTSKPCPCHFSEESQLKTIPECLRSMNDVNQLETHEKNVYYLELYVSINYKNWFVLFVHCDQPASSAEWSVSNNESWDRGFDYQQFLTFPRGLCAKRTPVL